MSGNSAQVNAAIANKIILTGFVPFFLKFARQFHALWNSPKKRHLLAQIGVSSESKSM
jgi:hypothetical protein